jgi:hypothetical protein
MEAIRAGARAFEALGRAREVAEESAQDTAQSDAARDGIEAARSLLAAGMWKDAEESAGRALQLALAASPSAARARRAIEALEEALSAHRTADAPREVAHQLAAANAALAAADFEHALHLADAARWVVDAGALDDEDFRALVVGLWVARGWRAEVGAGRPPPGGMVMSKGGERVLLVMGAWREYPAERVLLAAKDFLRAGHAQRATVYSSAFANTSTDPTIRVLTARELLADLVEATAIRGNG